MATGRLGDLVIFCDTGREHADTYRFIRDFIRITGIAVIWLKGDFRKEVIIAESMIPNHFKRKCTINLKIKKVRRYLRSIGLFKYTQFVGFRADEPVRVKEYKERWQQVKTIFPLDVAGIEKPEILLFWKGKDYDLKIHSIQGNCSLCFEKGESATIALIQNDPSIADIWIEDEESKIINPNGYTYFKGTTIRKLKEQALSLKKIYNLEDFTPKFNCACTS